MRPALRAAALTLLLTVVACSSSPGALGRAESTGILTVGAVDSPPAVVPGEGGEVTGGLADAITGYAESIGAEPTWQVGEPDALAAAAERGEIDVVIGVPADQVPDGMTVAAERDGASALVTDDEEALRDSMAEHLGG